VTGRKKTRDLIEGDLMDFEDDLRFGMKGMDNYVDAVHGRLREMAHYIYNLEDELEQLKGDRDEIEKLLKSDKSAIIEALEETREKVKIGRGTFLIDIAVEKYQMELEEVLTRVNDQKLIGSKGNVVMVKRTLCDFVRVLRCFVRVYRKYRDAMNDRENEFVRFKQLAKERKERIDELEQGIEDSSERISDVEEERDRLQIRVGNLLQEIEELKKPRLPTSLNQKRTIQK
jgi:DNA repair exonuclease SbcCD ATPase subunit